ncbi:hypothetical protein CYLTODRAFT_445142 [Cylindrobasidium torrendii FP15055 ss-10]|uniref:Nucleoside diphosphate kinase n=1 Tax=Cylindrobasidium torrendii FP15055 ss-10 TaxID=1314674 RepID=A0A0D7B8A3_9AGAR|nr:hypothetical protein CYLTODRAFT_445142 [Cylindrobasidium torrendii FP15055 ss-10]
MRSLAVILPSHAEERLNIETALNAQAAEILKERAMHLEPSAYLEELFPNAPIDELTRDKVWVYVLETSEPLADLGPGVVVSPDPETAEAQIAALFASSPIFGPEDMEANAHGDDGLLSQTSSMPLSPNSDASPGSSIASPASSMRRRSSGFQARALPATTHAPDIAPRMTRAASLRSSNASSAGGLYKPNVGESRKPLTKERLQETFDGVPGHKRRESIAVKSTATPTIAPRLTKAAMLRLGIDPAKEREKEREKLKEKAEKEKEKKPRPSSMQPPATRRTVSEDHKRSPSSYVPPPPTIVPRLNRSASLRAQPVRAPPSSFMFKGPAAPPSRPPSAQSNRSRPPSAQSVRSPSSTSNRRPSLSSAFSSTTSATSVTTDGASDARKTPSIPRPPSITPRLNKSAALRAAQKEAQTKANAQQPAKKIFV